MDVAAAGATLGVALAQLALVRRWDGVPLLGWLTVVAWVWRLPASPAAWALWGATALLVLVAVWRRPAWLGRPELAAVAAVLSGGLVAAHVAGLPLMAHLAVGGVVAVGLLAASVDRRRRWLRTRWVGEIEVHERS